MVYHSLKHYMGLCEVGSILGPVIDVDMEGLKGQNLVRIKMGIRDPAKLPVQTEIVTRDLLMYDLFFTLDAIVEEGWHCNLRAVNVRNDDRLEQGNPKKQRKDLSIREVIQLGSPSLAQFESAKKNASNAVGSRFIPLVEDEEISSRDGGQLMQLDKIKQVEEELSRKAALVEREKRTLMELAQEKARMESELQLHQSQLEKTNKQLMEVQKLLDIHKEYGVEAPNSQNSQEQDRKDVDDDEELLDYTTSQELEYQKGNVENEASQEEGNIEERNGKEEVPFPRRCGRLRAKELKRVEDMAIDRAAAKDNVGKGMTDDLSFLSCDDLTLQKIASSIGINLGVAIDMVDHNIGLLRDFEQARINLYTQQERVSDLDNSAEKFNIISGDKVLNELLLELDEENKQAEDLDLEGFQLVENKKKTKKSKRQSPDLISVKALMKVRKGKR